MSILSFTSEKDALDEITRVLEAKLSQDPFVQHSESLNNLHKKGASNEEIQAYYDNTFYNKGLNPPNRPFSEKD
ncbi:hypothetical protein AB4Z22_32230 [Paenibacillus sp. TAF58]